MDRNPSNLVKASANEPHDLLARLYREVGVSAVAAALAPTAKAAPPAEPAPVHRIADKAAA